MKYLDGIYYVEVKDHRYRIHPTENFVLRLRDELKSLRFQYQVQNQTQIRRNQKVNKNNIDELIVKNYPKNKQPITQQPKFKPPNCPSCKENNWLEFDKGYYCKNCEYIINKQKHKKVLRQGHYFSTRLNYANKKIREIWMNMVNTTYNSSNDMINKLPSLKGETKLNFYENVINFYDEMKNRNFQTQEDPFAKNDQSISKIYHEVLLLVKFLQTKPRVKNMNINYNDLYYTVIKTRDENEFIVDKYENIENAHISLNVVIIPNQHVGIKGREK